MPKIHVICAFYRKYLLPTHLEYLTPMDIEWIVACDEVDIEPFKDNNRDWIKPVLVPPLKIPGDQVYKKFNNCIERIDIIDDDYYCFMGDDDMYEPGFFDAIRQQTAKVVIVSASRGNNVPRDVPPAAQQAAIPLIMRSLGDIRVCNINLTQYVIKGEILKQIRFNDRTQEDDGYFAEDLVRRFSSEIKIIPELFTFINYFQPGRYTNNDWKIKPTWELPVIL